MGGRGKGGRGGQWIGKGGNRARYLSNHGRSTKRVIATQFRRKVAGSNNGAAHSLKVSGVLDTYPECLVG